MKRIIISVIFVITAVSLYATAQFPDSLLYKGETVSIFSNPLESFFSRENPRPDKLFKYSCTACWRGYIAFWEIRDDRLYLVKVIEGTCSPDAPEIDMSKLFGRKFPVEAVWFSGTLRIPRGKLISYVHMGYASVYEKELFLIIEKGRLVKEEIVDNTKKKIKSEEERAVDELKGLKEWEDKSGKK